MLKFEFHWIHRIDSASLIFEYWSFNSFYQLMHVQSLVLYRGLGGLDISSVELSNVEACDAELLAVTARIYSKNLLAVYCNFQFVKRS